MIKKEKNLIIEILENNKKTYFCVNRYFGEIEYKFTEDINEASKFDENQAKIYTQHYLKDKNCNIVKFV